MRIKVTFIYSEMNDELIFTFNFAFAQSYWMFIDLTVMC